MNIHSNISSVDLVERVVQALTSEDTPERCIEQALALLGREPAVPVGQDKKVSASKHLPDLIGTSTVMEALQMTIQRVAQTSATVLLHGESGTGKELVAHRIHAASLRAHCPFVAVHCTAIPENLIESALFGHERGAFTGAYQRTRGRLEQAVGGTLFLDEVGDLSVSAQVKLLRVLQEKEYERVGGHETLSADIRVIAATHRNLKAMLQSGEFREDFYYRLNVVPVVVPPLRNRKEDVPLLVHTFLRKFNRAHRRTIQFAPSFVTLLSGYHWPGNVRELQNCVERLVVLSDAAMVDSNTIPHALSAYFARIQDISVPPSRANMSSVQQTLSEKLDVIERDRLRQVLAETGWVKTKAARRLGMTARQVAYRIQKYHLTQEMQAGM